MRRWVAMSPNRFTFQVCSASSKRECLGWVCLLDRGNLAACGHWWHLCVHFQDVLGKPSRRMLWYRQKWSFLKASDETVKWLDRRERMRELRRHYTEIFLSFSLMKRIVQEKNWVLSSTVPKTRHSWFKPTCSEEKTKELMKLRLKLSVEKVSMIWFAGKLCGSTSEEFCS